MIDHVSHRVLDKDTGKGLPGINQAEGRGQPGQRNQKSAVQVLVKCACEKRITGNLWNATSLNKQCSDWQRKTTTNTIFDTHFDLHTFQSAITTACSASQPYAVLFINCPFKRFPPGVLGVFSLALSCYSKNVYRRLIVADLLSFTEREWLH